MKLCDMVTLKIDNAECVVLKVKDGQEMNLLGLGCFNGNEKILRLTKGKTVTCTVICDDGHRYSWHWGADGYTLVTDAARRKGQMIQVIFPDLYCLRRRLFSQKREKLFDGKSGSLFQCIGGAIGFQTATVSAVT